MDGEKRLVAKTGKVTTQPEICYSAKGNAHTHFNIESKRETIEISAYFNLAECIAESIVVGDHVVVVGKGGIETWQRRQRKVITADALGPDLKFTTCEVHRIERRTVDV